MALLVWDIRLPGRDSDLRHVVLERLGVEAERLGQVRLVKRSLDARHGRQVWRGACRVDVRDEEEVLVAGLHGVRRWNERDDGRYGLVNSRVALDGPWSGPPVVVVGAGPAGLYATLTLVEAGARVLLLERGRPTEERVRTVNAFWARRTPLDVESNLLFGEGGAGTFSDGKLTTRRRDGELGFILERLVAMGAPRSILTEAHPHLGTDRLRMILPRLRAHLRERGAEVRFSARVVGLRVADGRVRGVGLAGGEELDAHAVLVAPGHSARDTLQMLVDAGAEATARPIAVGVRVEHPQALINSGRYGGRGRRNLPAASYRLTWSPPEGRRAHTFCMCPGGVVVPAVCHPDRLVVNGMSAAARSGRWANSAIVVQVRPEDYGGTGPLAGYAWQDAVEARAFAAGGGDWTAPAQRVVDLFAGRASSELPSSSYPMGLAPADLRAVLPGTILQRLQGALLHFESQLRGFAGAEALLIAPETRTTSPVRIMRGRDRQSTTVRGLYPVGEGTGYGGGIVSCALDGVKSARALLESVRAT